MSMFQRIFGYGSARLGELHPRTILPLIVASACTMVPTNALASESPWVDIVNVGGQGDLVFIVVSQPVSGDAGCSGTRIILSASTYDAEQIKRVYAAALAAISSSKKMKFYLSGCWSGGFPSMLSYDYWWMQP